MVESLVRYCPGMVLLFVLRVPIIDDAGVILTGYSSSFTTADSASLSPPSAAISHSFTASDRTCFVGPGTSVSNTGSSTGDGELCPFILPFVRETSSAGFGDVTGSEGAIGSGTESTGGRDRGAKLSETGSGKLGRDSVEMSGRESAGATGSETSEGGGEICSGAVSEVAAGVGGGVDGSTNGGATGDSSILVDSGTETGSAGG